MKVTKVLARTLVTLALMSGCAHAQNATIQDWKSLVPLESTRVQVEAILGKPYKHFDTYGLYETEIGRFSVWYSDGRCLKKREGLQYKVKPNRFVSLRVSPKATKALAEYSVDRSIGARVRDPHSDRIFVSVLGGPTYVVYPGPGGTEIVDAIGISPGKDGDRLLCPAKDLI